MDDLRWFAPNRFSTLVVPRLRERGLTIALAGEEPARLAIAMSATVAADAYRYAARVRCPLILYVWDLPPWWLGTGRHDWVWYVLGHYVRVPRPGRRYRARRGYFSRVRFVAAHAHEVWAPSATSAASVRARFGVPCARVPYCYDSDRFAPAPGAAPGPPPGERPRVLVSVSRLTPQKNHAAVIRAAARFDPKLAVRIIGEGSDRSALERLAAELGVACAVAGGLDDTALLAAYRSAGVVVCASRFEGFGLTPMEAIACGVPVVASDIPVHREFLGPAPRFFTLDDDESLAVAIAAARSTPPADPEVLRDLTIEAAARRFFDLLSPHLG